MWQNVFKSFLSPVKLGTPTAITTSEESRRVREKLRQASSPQPQPRLGMTWGDFKETDGPGDANAADP